MHELDTVRRHLATVEAAADLSEEIGAPEEDLSAVRGRTAELRQLGRWCQTAGREVCSECLGSAVVLIASWLVEPHTVPDMHAMVCAADA